MTIDAALFAELKTIGTRSTPNAAVYAEGAGVARNTDPYMTFERTSADHHRHMTAGAGLVSYGYDVNVYSRSRATVAFLVDAIREALDHRLGTIGAPAADLDVAAVFLEQEIFLYEPDRAGAAGGWHRANVGMILWLAETVTPAT